MASQHPMMLKNMAAAWEQQSKIEGHSEQARKMQNANIKALYEPLHAKLKALHEEFNAVATKYNEDTQKVAKDYTEAVATLRQKESELEAKKEEALQKFRAFPLPPTRNNAVRMVNQTLNKKSNNQKLNLLGNLAGKSTLFSKKQNRIAMGRNAFITKQFNLSRKNYNATTRREKNAVEKKYQELSLEISKLGAEIQELAATRQRKLTTLNADLNRKLQAMYKQWEPLVLLGNKYTEQYKNTLNSSFNTALTNLVLDAGDYAKALETALKNYRPAPPPRPVQYTYSYAQAAPRYNDYVNLGYGRRQRRNSYEAGQYLAEQRRRERKRMNSGDPNYDPSNRQWMW